MLEDQRICRFCLFEDTDSDERPLINLFQNYSPGNLIEKIKKVLNVEFRPKDKIPANICQLCINKLDYVCDFIDTCNRSEKQLTMLYGLQTSLSDVSQTSDKFEYGSSCLSNEKMESLRTNSDSSLEIRKKCSQILSINNLGLLKKKSGQFRKSSHAIMTQKKTPKEKNIRLRKTKSSVCFKCEICKKNFRNFLDYEVHKKTHNGQMIFKCGKCDKIFIDKIKCIEHEQKHKIPCKICNQQVLGKRMQAHLHKHAKEFKTKSANIVKIQAITKKTDQRFVCKTCSKTFNSLNRLNGHIKRSHTQKKLTFNPNRRKMSEKSRFRIHLKRLETNRIRKCKMCNKKFLTLKNLQEHMASHGNGGKTCPKCGKQFLYKNHFNKHVFQCFYKPRPGDTLKKTSSLPTLQHEVVSLQNK